MLWSSILLPVSLLFAGVLGDKPSKQFTEFQSQALSSSPIKLNDASYTKLTAQPRDYAAAVLLTAGDPRYGCQVCREFGPELDLLATQWTKGDKAGDSRLIFGVLDFSDGMQTFQKLGLQTAPVLLLFQPTTGEFASANSDPLRYDFNAGKPTAESVHAWIVRHTPGAPHPAFSRPFPIFSAAIALVSVLGIATAIYQLWDYVAAVATNRNLWRAGTIIAVLFFTSGVMFNQIRNTPYAGHDGRGHISYLQGGFQTQFGIETHIIAFLYGALGLLVIGLLDRLPRIQDSRTQSILAIGIVIAILIFYSLLLSIFRVKNGGYPFSLPPFL